MTKEEKQERFINTQLMKIANSLSQTGTRSRADMIRFDLPLVQTYTILKIKEWLVLKDEIVKEDRGWYALPNTKFGIDAEKELTKMLTEEIDNAIREESIKLGNKSKASFKAQPNGR